MTGFNKLALIGVGLIGGSLVRALQRGNYCRHVVGCGRNVENLQQAMELGVIDQYTHDPAEAVQDADMVVVAVPLGAMDSIFAAIQPQLHPDAVVTDVGSGKATVVAAAQAHLGAHLPRFVPGHPIAGTENSGVAASFAELFENRKVILTPLDNTDEQARERVTTMWKATGAEVITMSIAHHDEVLAATSHLPHVLAFSLVDTLTRIDDHNEVFQFAAGGFRDFTRIASSNPQMWHDICLANREAILKILQQFNTDLAMLTNAIEQGDGATIKTVFERAKAARDDYCQRFLV